MTKTETENLKEEVHSPAKCFESRPSCLQVDIASLGRPELVQIVEQLPQRHKQRGVMSLSTRGDVVFVSNSGQAQFFRRSAIGDIWSFIHRRLLLIIALQNDTGSYDLHYFSMHRRRGVDLIFKLRKMVSEERMDIMRTLRSQEQTGPQMKIFQSHHQKDQPKPLLDISERPPSPEDLLASSPSLPPSDSQSSAGSWIDVLTAMRLDPHVHTRNDRSKGNPFREIGGDTAYQITNPFVLSAVQSCFRTPTPLYIPGRTR